MFIQVAGATETASQANSAGAKVALSPNLMLQQKRHFPRQPSRPPTQEELAAARGLEGLLVDHLIQEMRKSVPENEFMPASHGEKVFRQMLDSEYARLMSEAGVLGIADLIVAEMQGKR
ncbi:MAG: rod-binding protein [Bdellovibrionota bacterium]